jgi:hypothetical protein
MELLVFEPEAFGRLYNCDNFTVDQMPIGKRQHFWHGIILIGLFLLFEVQSHNTLFPLIPHVPIFYFILKKSEIHYITGQSWHHFKAKILPVFATEILANLVSNYFTFYF